jgi:hypothetical protein
LILPVEASSAMRQAIDSPDPGLAGRRSFSKTKIYYYKRRRSSINTLMAVNLSSSFPLNLARIYPRLPHKYIPHLIKVPFREFVFKLNMSIA